MGPCAVHESCAPSTSAQSGASRTTLSPTFIERDFPFAVLRPSSVALHRSFKFPSGVSVTPTSCGWRSTDQRGRFAAPWRSTARIKRLLSRLSDSAQTGSMPRRLSVALLLFLGFLRAAPPSWVLRFGSMKVRSGVARGALRHH
jgi:hypothetical protein